MKRSKWLLYPMFGVLVMVILIIIIFQSFFPHFSPYADRQNEKVYEAVVCSPITNYSGGKVKICEMLLTDGQKIKAIIFPIRRGNDFSFRKENSYLNRGEWIEVDSLKIGDGLLFKGKIQEDTSKYAWNDVVGVVKLNSSKMRRAEVDLSGVSDVQRTRLKMLMIREELLNVLRKNIGEEEYAIVAAMTMGDRSELGERRDIREVFSDSGTSHILALSGLHIGLIYSFLTMIFGRRKQKLFAPSMRGSTPIVGAMGILRVGGVLLAIWSFVLLVGLPISAVRSATMISIYALGQTIGRNSTSFNTLCFAGTIILLVSPDCLTDIGFQLSFLSVAGILLLHPILHPLLPHKKNTTLPPLSHLTHQATIPSFWLTLKVTLRPLVAFSIDKIWSMTIISISAQIASAPLVAYYFGNFSTVFLISNYVVIPLATLILYGTILFFTISFLPMVQSYFGLVLTRLTKIMIIFLRCITEIPFATIHGISLDWIEVVITYLIIILFFHWFNKNTAFNLKITLVAVIILIIKMGC